MPVRRLDQHGCFVHRRPRWLALVSIYQTDLTSFSKMEEVLNGYVTNPNPSPTLTPNRNPNSNPNQINKKIQKETILKTDQMT